MPSTYTDILTSDGKMTPGLPVAHMATTTLKVEGMTCGACTSAVESGFQGVDGVGAASVSLILGRAVVRHDPTKLSAEAAKDIIEDRGFDAEILSTDLPETNEEPLINQLQKSETLPNSDLMTTTLFVGGMTCGACTSAVEGAFKHVSGIKSFNISLLAERAVIEHDQAIIKADKLTEIIEDTGFDAEVVESKAAVTQPPTPTTLRKETRQSTAVSTTLAIEGMTCGACTSAIEGGFKNVDSVLQFNISLLAERAVIVHDMIKLSPEQIVAIIEERGFDARIISTQATESDFAGSTSSVQLKVYGVPNSKAATELETSLSSLVGIVEAVVNFPVSRVSITYLPASIGLRKIVATIENSGYNALMADLEDNNAQLESLAKTREIQEWRRALRISASFAIPVFLTSMVFPMILPFLDYGSIELPIPGLWLGDLVCLLLTIPVQFGIGRRFYVSAFKSLRHKSPTMDVLVVLGTSAAFLYSVAAMLVSLMVPQHDRPMTVFDTSTMLITFITMGRYLENGAKSQTSKALSRLMSLTPSMATIYVDAIAAAKLAEGWEFSEKKVDVGESSASAADERVIPTELIQVGDVVILRPGDKIAADGIVLLGESYVDESMVTGEAMPILKKPGNLLMAGTVNDAGRLDFRVTRAGRDTQLSQIVRLVQEAQTSRASIQRAADLVAGYFVPIIIVLGLITFFGWMILSHVLPHPPAIFMDQKSGGTFMICLKLCISVIVFACPCALGLATPTAVMVGTGVGAEHGILVKGGAALENAAKTTHVVFDKTGTLTTGKMSVTASAVQTPISQGLASWPRLFWTIIGLAEMSSEHPIGKAIVKKAKKELDLTSDNSFDGSIENFEAIPGKGISAKVKPAIGRTYSSHHILIGNAPFLQSHGVSVPMNPLAHISTDSLSPIPASGMTVIYTAVDTAFTGTLSLSDTLKPNAHATILALSQLGIHSSLITGDSFSTATHIASLIGIPPSRVHAQAPPSEKQRIIASLQATGAIVAMVGDGINDSPALATADTGMSLASGTDVAIETADVVLMRPDDLLAVPAALHLARAIFGRIKLNLLWACVYNAVGLPFAMGVLLPWGLSLHPMAAGAAMAASSVSVVGSSLLLRLWRRPAWMDVDVLEGRKMEPNREVELVILLRNGLAKMRSAYRRKRRTISRDNMAYVPIELEDVEDV